MENNVEMIKRTDFISTTPLKMQQFVEKELRAKGLSEEDIQNGLDGRFSDLEDTIDLQKIFG